MPRRPMNAGRMRAFLVWGTTGDGWPYAAGGFCREEEILRVQEAFALWKKTEFGPSSDGYLIDRKLSQMVRRTVGTEVFAAGASICIEGCTQPSGGVIGRPDRPDDSASGVREPVGEGFWLMAWPGSVGVLAQVSETEAEGLERRITRRLFGKRRSDPAGGETMSGRSAEREGANSSDPASGETKPHGFPASYGEQGLDRVEVLDLLDEVKRSAPVWLLVSDGCGTDAGGVFVSDGEGKEQGRFCLEIDTELHAPIKK